MNYIAGISTKTLSLASIIAIVLLICGLAFHSSLLSAIAVGLVSTTVIGLIVCVLLPKLLPRKTSSYPPPETIWSRGNYGITDHAGDNSREYLEAGTESKVQSLLNLRGKRGIVWLRIGSKLPNDIDIFVRDALPYLSGKTVLVTTDGDLGTPSDLNPSIVSTILDNDNIVAWYTQNLSIDYETKINNNQSKLHAFPIGLDLHSIKGTEPDEVWQMYQKIKSKHFVPWTKRQDKIFSDVHLTPSKCGIRKRWRKAMTAFDHTGRIHVLQKNVSRENLWSKFYCGIKFVMSLPGNGLDCHRTYEAAFFGAVVVTNMSSPFKQLWRKMNIPVVYCKDDFSDVLQKIDHYKPTQDELRFFTAKEWRKEMDALVYTKFEFDSN